MTIRADSRYYAIGSHDARVSLLSTRDWIVSRVFDAPTAPIRHVVFSHDGELIAAGGDDACVLILGVASGQVVARIPTAAGTGINALAWHPGKNVLAYSTSSKVKGVVWHVVGVE